MCGTAAAEIGTPNAVAVSPDGRNVYAATSGGTIGRFDRNPTSGVLTAAGCFADVSLANCGGVENRAAGLLGAFGVAVSPDGASVYVASGTLTSGAIVRFDRDPATGALTPRGCIQYTGGTDCVETTAGLHGATSVAVSRDGRSVYVTGARSDAIVRFDRGGDGALTPRGCVQNTGGVDCTAVAAGLDVPESVAVSPDGRSVYVASEFSSAVARFDRDQATGALTQRGCFQSLPATECGAESSGLFGAISVAVSDDGHNVYVASRDEPAVAWFVRNSSTGALTPAGCVGSVAGIGCGTASGGLQTAYSVAVSGDGRSVYVAGRDDYALVEFGRDEVSGALTPLGCLDEPPGFVCGGTANTVAGLRSPYAVAVSPDSANVYVASTRTTGDGALVSLSRELPPVCADVSSGGAPDAAQTITLACSDPNGDAVALDLVAAPTHGTLGAIDSATGQVTYTPASGYSGIDQFRFRASAGGLVSDEGTATVLVGGTVGAPGPAGSVGPPGPPGPAGPAAPGAGTGAAVTPLIALFAADRLSSRRGRALTFRFALTRAARVTIRIARGRRTLRTLTANVGRAGRATLKWNGRDARRRRPATGRYTVTLTATSGGERATDIARLTITR